MRRHLVGRLLDVSVRLQYARRQGSPATMDTLELRSPIFKAAKMEGTNVFHLYHFVTPSDVVLWLTGTAPRSWKSVYRLRTNLRFISQEYIRRFGIFIMVSAIFISILDGTF